MKVGDLVSRVSKPGELYRVTSVHGTAARGYVRLLPFQRAGGEVLISKYKGRWIDSSGTAWSEAS